MSTSDRKTSAVLDRLRDCEVAFRLHTDVAGYFGADVGYRGRPEAQTNCHRTLDGVVDWLIEHECSAVPNGAFAQWASDAGYYPIKPLVSADKVAARREPGFQNGDIGHLSNHEDAPLR